MREHRIRVADRALAVRDAGDPDGHPVVFFHGTPSSRLAVAAGEETAGEETVRLITPLHRPGYGQSDAAAFGLSSVTEDVEVFTDHLGLDRFAALGAPGAARSLWPPAWSSSTVPATSPSSGTGARCFPR